jgi:hypothetical protein
MKWQITVEVQYKYGTEYFIPKCDDAKTFAMIAGTVTLTRATMKHIRALGYNINITHPEVKL